MAASAALNVTAGAVAVGVGVGVGVGVAVSVGVGEADGVGLARPVGSGEGAVLPATPMSQIHVDLSLARLRNVSPLNERTVPSGAVASILRTPPPVVRAVIRRLTTSDRPNTVATVFSGRLAVHVRLGLSALMLHGSSTLRRKGSAEIHTSSECWVRPPDEEKK